jgi:hypothetical protein
MTAEWKCSKCGVTNRRLVPPGVTHLEDRCVTCKTRHTLEEGTRPVFWKAAPKS